MCLSRKIIIIIFFLILIIFQIAYYINSEHKHSEIYEKMLVDKAHGYFENIMLKKAQGLDENFSIAKELVNLKFELLKEDKELTYKLKKSKNNQIYYIDEKKDYFYYFKLLSIKKSCMNCHQLYKIDDVVGIAKISIPIQDYTSLYKNIHSSKYVYFIISIITTLIIVALVIWFLTKSKQKHLQLVRSQRNLEKAESMASLGHWRLDNRNNEITFSKNLLEIVGIKDERNVNLEFIMKNIIFKNDKFRLLRTFKKYVSLKKDIQIEFRIISRDKRVKKYVNCHITHIKAQDTKKAIVSIGTVQDITRFTTLKYRLSILEQAVNQAPISIMITDKNGNIEYTNPTFTKVTGYEAIEVIGKNPRILKSKDTDSSEYERLWKTISRGENWSGTFKNIKKTGEEFWELTLISPVFSEKSNKVIKYIAVKEEITSAIYLKQQLKYQEELMLVQSRHAAMGEMISLIAHQWRQPATVIALCANSILTDVILENISKESLLKNSQDIIDQTKYLSETIDNFRNFFKPNREKVLISIKDIIDETKIMMNATLMNTEIQLIENYLSDRKVKIYNKELVQVLINIIKNAQETLKEKDSGKKIIIINEYIENDKLILEICDNAGGIKKEYIEKIFEPYFTTKDEKNGTGLGLYISKVIVEKHLKGNIRAYNKDNGACFEIILNLDEK